jgi:hypothetical protein
VLQDGIHAHTHTHTEEFVAEHAATRAASDRLPRCVAPLTVLGNAHLTDPAAGGTEVNRNRCGAAAGS